MSCYDDYAKEQKKWEAAARLYVLLRAYGVSQEEALRTSTSCSYQECIKMIEDLSKRVPRWIKDVEDMLAKTYLTLLSIKLAQEARVPIELHYIERIPMVIAKEKGLPKVLYALAQRDKETAIEVLEELEKCGESLWEC